jgi:hypothetical protein
MDYESRFLKTVMLELDDLMQIAKAIEESSRSLTQTEFSK